MHSILNVALIVTMLVSIFLTYKNQINSDVLTKPNTVSEQKFEEGLDYGSGWDTNRGRVNDSLYKQPQANLLAKQPPADDINIYLEAEPAIYVPDKPVRVMWNITGNGKTISNPKTKIVLRLPEEAVPVQAADKNLLTAEKTMPLTSTRENKAGKEFSITKGTKPPYYFPIEVYDTEGKWINGNVVEVRSGIANIAKGKSATIKGWNGKVVMSMPAEAVQQNMVVDIGSPRSNTLPAVSLSGNPIEILAVDTDNAKNVKQFIQPINLQFTYSDEEAIGKDENDFKVYYYNEELLDWFPMETVVNAENNTLTVQSDHLTVFDYKSASWQANSLPTLDDFKVSEFTGAATYNLDFWTPPAPGGFQPSVSLQYNSQIIDEASAYSQASWVGMGWSLELVQSPETCMKQTALQRMTLSL